MVVESTSTNPVRAQLDIKLLFQHASISGVGICPLVSSSLVQIYMRAANFDRTLFFFIFPSTDLVHYRHCIGEYRQCRDNSVVGVADGAGANESVTFQGGRVTISVAATQGWTALRDVFRAWGISAPEDLTEWMGREGFPRCAAGNHISARAQEHSQFCVCSRRESGVVGGSLHRHCDCCWSTDGTSRVSRSSVGTQTASEVEWVCPR